MNKWTYEWKGINEHMNNKEGKTGNPDFRRCSAIFPLSATIGTKTKNHTKKNLDFTY